MPFKKIGLAVTFSPTGKALLREVKRLTEVFNSGLTLIHVGEKNAKTEELLRNIVSEAGMNYDAVEVFRTEGDPGNAIIKSSGEAGVDLLVAGALEKEKFIKYYTGSVARKIMREAPCSTLILTAPSEFPQSFKRFYVASDFSPLGEKTIKTAHSFAVLENAAEFVLVKDFHLPGLASSVLNSGSAEEASVLREDWIRREEETMKFYSRELNLSGLNVKVKALYGKQGWEAGNYVRTNNADIFVVPGPLQKLKFFDRLFTNKIEYLFEDLPANLLIIR